MREKLPPLLFVDEQKEDVTQRANVVDPVKRSDSAKKKDHTRRTADGKYPTSSFRDIIKNLPAITRSQVKIKDHQKESLKQHRNRPLIKKERQDCLEQIGVCSQ